jgi:hypothetical protein
MSHGHPPKAMVTRTSTIPRILIMIPIKKRLRPAYFPNPQIFRFLFIIHIQIFEKEKVQ